MTQTKLFKWLKLMIFVVGFCGLILFFYVLPNFGRDIAVANPQFSGWYWPWLIFLWCTGVPCYIVLFLGYKIAQDIGKERAFSFKNAFRLMNICKLAAVDCFVFFGGNVVFLLLDMNHPSVVLLSFFVVIVGMAVAVTSAVLSHMVYKAALLQQENDMTI